MQNAALVGVVDGPSHGGEIAGGGVRPQRAAGHQRAERLALDATHGEIRLPVHGAGVVDRHDVWVSEVRRGLRLRLETS